MGFKQPQFNEMYSICSTCGKDDFDTKGKIFFTRSNTKVSVCEICSGIVLHVNNPAIKGEVSLRGV